VPTKPRTRLFALSDIHVDFPDNMAWLQALSSSDYVDDALILAGDATDDLTQLQTALGCLRGKFAEVFFVPGNHELWIRRGECADSMAKFWRVLGLCASLGVRTSPAKIGAAGGHMGIWVVPLFSWYVQPEEGRGSLFVRKEGEDPTLDMWADKHFTKWPPWAPGLTVADVLLRLNEEHLHRSYDAPVISFSHFLPRLELMFSGQESPPAGVVVRDRHPTFNFSRVAGCEGLEAQIRQLGSMMHVYGHQHRNRYRHIDGVLYVSHCLGYPAERARGYVRGLENGPMLIWDSSAPNPPSA
jgi:predicted phosphodiesterase